MNAFAWILWLATNVIFILSARNPFYLVVSLAGSIIVGAHLAKLRGIKHWTLNNFRFVLTMVILSTLINSLFSHVGSATLFIIPESWPLVGGPVTIESLAYGAINGLVISTLYILFNIINLALSIKQITRLIPRAFHPVAMVVTISLTFFPTIQKRAREIKEAQMIRGNPMKRITDWMPIIIPLLVTSLENAILLAESMTARGFHQQTEFNSSNTVLSLILGAFLIFSGWMLQMFNYPTWIYFILYLFGGGVIVLRLIHEGKQSKVTYVQYEVWDHKSITITGLMLLSLICFTVFALNGCLTTLDYYPYPYLTMPGAQFFGFFFYMFSIIPIFFFKS